MASHKLACHLINDQFGELVQNVCECLLQRGSLLLSEISRYTGMDVAPLGECLKLLIQHNCVQAFQVALQDHGRDTAPKPNTFYMLILDNILHRMRFPKFLALVHDDLGSEAQALVSALLQHGRLTFEQLLKRAAECAQPSDVDLEVNVSKAFVELSEAHYIERCPLPEPSLELTEENQRARSQEQQVLRAAAQLEAQRFRLPSSVLRLQPEESLDSFVAGPDERLCSTPHTLVSDQPKEMGAPPYDDKDVVWRVNYDEFLRRLRHEACARLVRSTCGLGCGTVLACILEDGRTSKCLKEKVSSPVHIESIVRSVRNTEKGRCMPTERIRAALLQLAAHGFVVDQAGDQYAINMHEMLVVARRAEIEGIVLQRFGQKCCRIFRLLSTQGRLEHKQEKISDRSLTSSKEAWESLSKLVKERFVELEEKDPNSRRWHVNLEALTWTILSQMYHAAWSLTRRLSQADAEAGIKRRNIGKVLEASMSLLDDAIMLFHDF